MSERIRCTTHCFRCDKEMIVNRNGDGYMQEMISNGLFFQTRGNYGSTVYDPGDFSGTEEFLEIVICDDCIRRNVYIIDHVKVKFQKTRYSVALFEVDKE